MKLEFVKLIAEVVSSYIELIAITLISVTIIIIIFNSIVHLFKKNDDMFKIWRSRSWRGIQVALDLLVAADLISTIAIERDIESISTLAILLMVRTIVSWSLEVELDGCWPWQKKKFELNEKSITD